MEKRVRTGKRDNKLYTVNTQKLNISLSLTALSTVSTKEERVYFRSNLVTGSC